MGAVIFGLSAAQWLTLLPQAWQAIKVAQSIYTTLTTKENLDNAKATEVSLSLLGKALAKLTYDAVGMAVPLPHKMTFEEEQAWMNRATENIANVP